MTASMEKSAQPCVRNPFGWVEIPVNNMDRAKTFYGKTFGYEFQMQDMGESGASGALMLGPTYKPSYDGTVVYFSVENIDETLNRVNIHGGRIVQPKKSIGQYGSIAFFEDLEGNRIALHQQPG